ncbi:hypothetical protein MCOR25_000194 [Pyricularia grisea]|uniref:Chitin-binding type-1 domain-containing protein n=1 Tax=Pyricularia grisea TaxID=148305 RepID=A0A6P8BJH1_PYRGI|nr:uncharacterized protein PgNI_02318 [Pyricularia grisea]KAI6383275.1 hypothetical protein MCOR25_000194 [Pyricularia grisea]TLD16840.1 hypothetical protein PgNI_02318 [Pyricularia grisea]
MKFNTAFCITVFTISVTRAIPVPTTGLTARGATGAGAGAGTGAATGGLKPAGLEGKCGAGFTCEGFAKGTCCSQFGYCGSSEAHCGTGCNPAFGTCGTSSGGANPSPDGKGIPTTSPAAGIAPSTPPTTGDNSTATKNKPVDANNPPATPDPTTPNSEGTTGTRATGTANPASGAAGSGPAQSSGTTPPAPPPLTVESPTKQNNGTATTDVAKPGASAASIEASNPAIMTPAAPATNGTLPAAGSTADKGSLDDGKIAPVDPATTAASSTDGNKTKPNEAATTGSTLTTDSADTGSE